jgi:hypothetical protein
MIPGVSDLCNVFKVLVKLDVVEEEVDLGSAANYCMAFSPDEIRIKVSEGEGDDFDELCEEELKMMSFYNKGYDRWYDEKLTNIVSNMLLGDEDDT